MSVPVSCPSYVWWLVPEKLAGMSRPPLEDLTPLYQAGMRGIVSVMDEPSGIEEYREAGFKALWLPITGGKPPTVEAATLILNSTFSKIQNLIDYISNNLVY